MIEHKLSRGDMVTLFVEETNIFANGVAKIDGTVVFCEGAVAGDVVIALITEVKKNYALAKALKTVTSSPCRSEPRCPYFGKCGGCAFGNVTYEHEVFVKKSTISAAFRRCGVKIPEINEFISSKETGYRNKAVFHFDEELDLGFFSKADREICPVKNCAILHPTVNIIMKKVEDILRERKDGLKGKLSYLFIRYFESSNEASVVIGSPLGADLSVVASRIISEIPQVKTVMRGTGDDPACDVFEKLEGNDSVLSRAFGLELEVAPASFFQVNCEVGEKLFERVGKLAAPKTGERFLDLYCGTGTIALSLAKREAEIGVVGIEISPEAVENSKRNAERNGIENTTFICADSEEFSRLLSREHFDCITVDPPRAGLSEKTVRQILENAPNRLVYVSCDPSTLARDVRLLSGLYEPSEVIGADMFPGTSHVETCVLLVKTSASED